LSRFF